ncbi:SDR family oxidoreductase [Chryseosolibacter indicus]|uniref:SDR family oxidoreductase n=1 Tax=Chryseosolibacter indicus TaxID=2782351 RepID=A0ABS5VPZ1_9BACT|nr:SDR family oxidoreductase [Chryseosolibacter indicus]MBT1702862.1 SDR family oxidoreductase [Chryseosolibacter indicus]
MKQLNTIEGKVILVTGAARGLGAAICRILSEDGAIMIATDVNASLLEKTVNEITSQGKKAYGYTLNVTDENNVEETVKKIVNDHGKIDVIVNNAGVDYTKSIEELSYKEWRQVIDVNLTGPFIVTKAVYPYMKKNGSGHIINITSTASKRAWPNASAYHASKWGLSGFSHAIHSEARKDKIKVTALVAGGMQTPFLLDRFPDIDLNLLQNPENVAESIRYVLTQPNGSVIPELMVIPMTETSWP